MKEQSHKDEMSAAIRGDFQRLRDRGVAATLAPRDDEDGVQPELSVAIDAPAPEIREVVTATPSPEPCRDDAAEPFAEPDAGVVDVAATDASADARTGFLARFLGR